MIDQKLLCVLFLQRVDELRGGRYSTAREIVQQALGCGSFEGVSAWLSHLGGGLGPISFFDLRFFECSSYNHIHTLQCQKAYCTTECVKRRSSGFLEELLEEAAPLRAQ